MQINSVGDNKIKSFSKFISSKLPDKYLISSTVLMQSGFSFKISKMSQDLHLLHDFDVLIAVICIWVRNKTYINGYISINYVKHFLRFPHLIFHLTRILIICFGHGSILIIALMKLLISHYNLKVCTQIALLKQLIK